MIFRCLHRARYHTYQVLPYLLLVSVRYLLQVLARRLGQLPVYGQDRNNLLSAARGEKVL